MTDQPTQQQPVQPQPIPANWTVAAADPPHKFVVITVVDFSGTRVLFLEPDVAVVIGNAMVTASRQARSGLLITGQQLPPVNGQRPVS